MKRIPAAVPAARRERGAVLIVALVVLLILTILGVAGMQSTVLEERMAGNMRDRNLAFQAAEAALRAGELDAQAGTNIDFDVLTAPAPDDPADDTVWQATTTIAYADDLAGVAAAPEYIIERQQGIPPVEADQPMPAPLLRVTARGVGTTATSVVVLQSIYKP